MNERLTDKGTRMISIEPPDSKEVTIYNKLASLEDLEDELGIDLPTLFEALKNGVYAKDEFNYMGKRQSQIIFSEYTYFYYADDIGAYFIHVNSRDYYLKDYGKTWALNKEELK